jgi:hypothetical protein
LIRQVAGDTDVVIMLRSDSSGPAGYRFPREVIAVAVRWYLRYGLYYRDRRATQRSRLHRCLPIAQHNSADTFYDDLFKPSLVALWLSQPIVFAAYPRFAARHDSPMLAAWALSTGSTRLRDLRALGHPPALDS